jgi:hypothetical protein
MGPNYLTRLTGYDPLTLKTQRPPAGEVPLPPDHEPALARVRIPRTHRRAVNGQVQVDRTRRACGARRTCKRNRSEASERGRDPGQPVLEGSTFGW